MISSVCLSPLIGIPTRKRCLLWVATWRGSWVLARWGMWGTSPRYRRCRIMWWRSRARSKRLKWISWVVARITALRYLILDILCNGGIMSMGRWEIRRGRLLWHPLCWKTLPGRRSLACLRGRTSLGLSSSMRIRLQKTPNDPSICWYFYMNLNKWTHPKISFKKIINQP